MQIISIQVKKVSLKKIKIKLISEIGKKRKICSREKLKPLKNHWNYSRKLENIEANAGWKFSLRTSLIRMIQLK